MSYTQAQKLIMQEDLGLAGVTLDDKYNPEGDGEHPVFTRDDWRSAVSQQDTISGYWDWVAHRIAEETGDD